MFGAQYDLADGRHMLAREGADVLSRNKRLTDAELAAEYYAQDSKCRHEQWIETVRGDGDYTDEERAGQSRMYEQLTALHRFATMAHYDQEEAQA
jgi:hypothetical protein